MWTNEVNIKKYILRTGMGAYKLLTISCIPLATKLLIGSSELPSIIPWISVLERDRLETAGRTYQMRYQIVLACTKISI